MTPITNRIEQLEEELRQVRETKNEQYWAFTRRANAPPVDPSLCRREVELEAELRDARRVAP